MSQKTLINGTAYEITQGRTLVDGTGYDILQGRTLVGGTGYDILFGLRLRKLPVGTSVLLNVDGAETEFIIVNQGNPDPSIYDESCNDTWLMSKKLQRTNPRNYQSGDAFGENNDYKSSNAHTVFAPAFFERLDDVVQNVVKEVKIPYVNGTGNVGSVASGSNGLPVKIFSLSTMEVGGDKELDCDTYVFADGTMLDWFYRGAGSQAIRRRIASYSDTESGVASWWLRSPSRSSAVGSNHIVDRAGRVLAQTTFSGGVGNDQSLYRPTMILPGSLRVAPVDSESYTLIL